MTSHIAGHFPFHFKRSMNMWCIKVSFNQPCLKFIQGKEKKEQILHQKTNAWNKNAKCKYTASFHLIYRPSYEQYRSECWPKIPILKYVSKIIQFCFILNYRGKRDSFWSILHFYSVSSTHYSCSRVFFFLPVSVGLQGQRPRIDYWWNADGRIVEHKQ